MITWGCFFFILNSFKIWYFFRYQSWKLTGLPKLDQLSQPNWKAINSDENYWLYLILCQKKKYYVGITKNLHRRRKEEFSLGPRCPKWMLKHKPVRYLGVLPLKTKSKRHAEKLETAFTKHLFKEFGRKNVRGGRYAAPHLFRSHR